MSINKVLDGVVLNSLFNKYSVLIRDSVSEDSMYIYHVYLLENHSYAKCLLVILNKYA